MYTWWKYTFKSIHFKFLQANRRSACVNVVMPNFILWAGRETQHYLYLGFKKGLIWQSFGLPSVWLKLINFRNWHLCGWTYQFVWVKLKNIFCVSAFSEKQSLFSLVNLTFLKNHLIHPSLACGRWLVVVQQWQVYNSHQVQCCSKSKDL